MKSREPHLSLEKGSIQAIPKPVIPLAERNGGLGYLDIVADPTASIDVLMPPSSDFTRGDTLQVLWGEPEVQVAEHVITDDDILRTVVFRVPVTRIEQLGQGTKRVVVRVQSGVSPPTRPESPPIYVRIKLTVPGGIDPDPATPHENESLTPCTITPSPIPPSLDGVRVTVPAYANMAEGDVITVSWHGHSVTHGPLSPDEVAGNVAIPIHADVIRAAGGPKVLVRYEVRDRVNNWSLWSPILVQDVPIENPDAPTAPWVEGTTGNSGRELDMDRIGTGDISVKVENHTGAAGDRIGVHWKGMTAIGQPTRFDTEEQTLSRHGETLAFAVPNARAAELTQGHVNVTYTLHRQDGSTIESKRRLLNVVGSVAALDPPSVKEAVGHVLDPDKTTAGATVWVRPWGGITSGDICSLEWRGTRSDGTPTYFDTSLQVTSSSVERGVTFIVPAVQVAELKNGRVRLRYTVDTLGKSRSEQGARNVVLAHLESPWLELEVRDGAGAMLPAPTVPEVTDGMLDPQTHPFAHLQIPTSEYLRSGDNVEASITGGKKVFQDSTRVANPAVPPKFLLEPEFISANRDERLEAIYRVTRAGFQGQSAGFVFSIGEVVQNLPAPVLPDFSDDSIDLGSVLIGFHQGLRIKVNAYPGMAMGQEIELRFEPDHGAAWSQTWTVERTGEQPIQVIPIGRLLNLLDAGARQARVRYHVRARGGAQPIESQARTLQLFESQLSMPNREDFEDAPGGPFRHLELPAMVIDTEAEDVLVWDGKKRWIPCPWCPPVTPPQPTPPETEFPPYFMGARIAYGGNDTVSMHFTFKRRSRSVTFGYGCYGPGGGGRTAKVHAFDPEDKLIAVQDVVTPHNAPGNCLFVKLSPSGTARIASVRVTMQGDAEHGIPMLDNFLMEY